MLISFVVTVILPFVASILYFAFIASDQYIAETRFAVRSLAEGQNSDSVDSSILSMSTMPQDGFIVTNFIHSSEILDRLENKINYRRMFTQDGIDYLSRFDKDESKERFLKYWANQVMTYIDGPSGIITLKTRTFSPDDSKALASAILVESEALINELSERAQRDMIARFRAELDRTTGHYRAALEAMRSFQNASGLLTPEARATETGTLLTGLLAQKLELETRLFVLKESNAESSPAHQQLVLASQNLEIQIDKLKQDLAGDSDSAANVASVIRDFSRIETDRRVAESLYEAARKNLEMAQAEALRKGLYLVVFVPPTVPEESLYPHRVSTPLLLLLALAVAWLTGALMWASIEDHKL
ncbi:capsule biosynthesis protein [Rhizobiaceae bacterium BDR2-2]|uniref:Capsule biosynthesis protein n=1 Tax=Ectorhizobium quercum TaxID=2965071 RepID=A0AAE3SVC8_9HYPH|nr:capsule biosynthesis protein [Ectorhizobium quercum]MCX8996205.1 capsule biosynthesis protein [Ectorhizobium quercum]MCX8998756.1 capsule biosynthesis protein [Ectorhizobium quercum]